MSENFSDNYSLSLIQGKRNSTGLLVHTEVASYITNVKFYIIRLHFGSSHQMQQRSVYEAIFTVENSQFNSEISLHSLIEYKCSFSVAMHSWKYSTASFRGDYVILIQWPQWQHHNNDINDVDCSIRNCKKANNCKDQLKLLNQVKKKKIVAHRNYCSISGLLHFISIWSIVKRSSFSTQQSFDFIKNTPKWKLFSQD